MLKDMRKKKEEYITGEKLNSGVETEDKDKKRSQSSQEMDMTKGAKILQKEDENNKTQGSVDTFIPQ